MRFFYCVLSLLLVSNFAISKQENPKKEDKTEAPPIIRRITVNGDVMKRMLVHKVTPRYPIEARQQRISGTVKLHVIIGVDGSVKDIEYVSGPRALVQATVDGVRQYKYKPTKENGEPVEVDTTVETLFELRE
jgi:periplasmic protein TonB